MLSYVIRWNRSYVLCFDIRLFTACPAINLLFRQRKLSFVATVGPQLDSNCFRLNSCFASGFYWAWTFRYQSVLISFEISTIGTSADSASHRGLNNWTCVSHFVCSQHGLPLVVRQSLFRLDFRLFSMWTCLTTVSVCGPYVARIWYYGVRCHEEMTWKYSTVDTTANKVTVT